MCGNGKVTKQPSDGPQEQRIIRRGGMIIEFDHEIVMDDGVLRCDIYRPCSKESCPAFRTLPFRSDGRGLHWLGNIAGYLTAVSKKKFLEIHGLEDFTD